MKAHLPIGLTSPNKIHYLSTAMSLDVEGDALVISERFGPSVTGGFYSFRNLVGVGSVEFVSGKLK